MMMHNKLITNGLSHDQYVDGQVINTPVGIIKTNRWGTGNQINEKTDPIITCTVHGLEPLNEVIYIGIVIVSKDEPAGVGLQIDR